MQLGLYDVIEYDGEELIYKYTHDDFNTLSTLYANETQEAYIYNKGRWEGPFCGERVQLSNENIPGLKGLVSFLGNGLSPFHCMVYFISKNFYNSKNHLEHKPQRHYKFSNIHRHIKLRSE